MGIFSAAILFLIVQLLQIFDTSHDSKAFMPSATFSATTVTENEISIQTDENTVGEMVPRSSVLLSGTDLAIDNRISYIRLGLDNSIS